MLNLCTIIFAAVLSTSFLLVTIMFIGAVFIFLGQIMLNGDQYRGFCIAAISQLLTPLTALFIVPLLSQAPEHVLFYSVAVIIDIFVLHLVLYSFKSSITTFKYLWHHQSL